MENRLAFRESNRLSFLEFPTAIKYLMRVLGIDPGSETLGWGVVEGSGSKYKLVDYGTVRSSPRIAFSKRILKVYDGVREVIARHQPDAMSIEEAFYAVNDSLAMKLGKMSGSILMNYEKYQH
jgi:crossover junction endodeoxyribonuclease RuvC